MSHIKITASGEKEQFYGNFILSCYGIGFFGPIVAFIWLIAGTLEFVDWYDFGKALKKKGIQVDDNLWRN